MKLRPPGALEAPHGIGGAGGAEPNPGRARLTSSFRFDAPAFPAQPITDPARPGHPPRAWRAQGASL